WITPLAEALGLPLWIADLTGFVLALIIVTFLHLVVGEMAPKSWAVAHPERSAIMLAVPMRAFMVLTRPLLQLLNSAANLCLRLVGVRPVDEVDQAHTSEDLRQLLRHSARAGTLEKESSDALLGALELSRISLDELVAGREAPTVIAPGATAGQVRAAARATRHRRILVRTAAGGAPGQGARHRRSAGHGRRRGRCVRLRGRPVTDGASCAPMWAVRRARSCTCAMCSISPMGTASPRRTDRSPCCRVR